MNSSAILRRLAGILFGPLIIMALFVSALVLLQNRLLYFPTQVALENYVPDGLALWPVANSSSGATESPAPDQQSANSSHGILGLIGTPANEQDVIGTAIVFHGNAGHAGQRTYYAQQLTPLGLRTILAEYPGYGPRSGSPSEDALVNEGVTIVRKAYEQYGSPIWLIGESLGAGVVAAVLKQIPSLAQGIVLITPWNRLVDVAAYHYPFLPVRCLLRSDYDSVAALDSFTGPKLVIVAENDNIVPARFGLDLHEKINTPKRLVQLSGTGHNDWITAIEPSFWREVIDWLQLEG